MGDALQTYATTPNIVPNSLTWEKSTTYDIGLDVDMLSNRLSMVFDYYQRYTTDMYTVGPTLPAVLGAATPKGNNAEMKTKGWELSVMWRDNFTLANKPFNYSVKAMLWDSRTWVTKFNNPTKLLSTYYEGQDICTIWGYHIEGLFKDQAEIDQGYLALECFRRHGRAPASRGKPEDDPAGGLSFQICLSGSKNRRCFPHA